MTANVAWGAATTATHCVASLPICQSVLVHRQKQTWCALVINRPTNDNTDRVLRFLFAIEGIPTNQTQRGMATTSGISRRQTVTFELECTLIIEEFARILALTPPNEHPAIKYRFIPPGHEAIPITICIYPRGESCCCLTDYIAISMKFSKPIGSGGGKAKVQKVSFTKAWVDLLNKNDEPLAYINLYMINRDEETCTKVMSCSSTYTHPNLQHEYVLENLIDGMLKMYFTATVTYEKKISIDRHSEKAQFTNELMQYLVADGEHSDFTILVQEEGTPVDAEEQMEKIKVHKAFMGAHSPFFAALFRDHFGEQQQQIIITAPVEIVKDFVQYCYIGKIGKLNPEKAVQLLILADKYQVSGLKNRCEVYLTKKVTVDNCAQLLMLGDLYSAEVLKEVCLEFFGKNSDEVIESDGWAELAEKCVDLMALAVMAIVDGPSNAKKRKTKK